MIACTTDRDVEAPVQTTVRIQMLEVICTTGIGMALGGLSSDG